MPGSASERRVPTADGVGGPVSAARSTCVATAGARRVNGAVGCRAPHVPSTQHGRRTAPLDFLTLTKPRLNLLVLMTTLGGLYLASPDGVPLACCSHTLVGTALVAGGAAALNQVWERETDRADAPDAQRGRCPAADSASPRGTWFGVAAVGRRARSSSRSAPTHGRGGGARSRSSATCWCTRR